MVKRAVSMHLNMNMSQNNDFDTHYIFDRNILRVGPLHFPRERLQNYTKAMFVRHPFERLVSSYVDKTLGPPEFTKWFYETYWNKILGQDVNKRNVTFPEFVEFLLREPMEDSDEHWAPYHLMCEPCLFDYDIVGKLETGNRDFRLLFSRVGIKSQEVRLTNTRADIKVQFRSAKEYFAELNFSTVMRLYERYFYDFELFDYDFRDYLPRHSAASF